MSSIGESGLTDISATSYEFSHSDKALICVLRNLSFSFSILCYVCPSLFLSSRFYVFSPPNLPMRKQRLCSFMLCEIAALTAFHNY